MSLSELCSIGDLYDQIIEFYDETGNVSSELIAKLINKVQPFENSEELITLLHELKDNTNNDASQIAPTLDSSLPEESKRPTKQKQSVALARVVRPSIIRSFMHGFKSFLTKDVIVQRVVSEIESRIGESIIDTLRQHDFTTSPVPSAEADLKKFFDSLRNNYISPQ